MRARLESFLTNFCGRCRRGFAFCAPSERDVSALRSSGAPASQPGGVPRAGRCAGLLTAALLGGGLSNACVIGVVDTPNCGVNAYDAGGTCACLVGYDGDPYEACDPLIDLLITDLCDDGLDIEWRIFAEERSWVWPDGSQVFVTAGYDVDTVETLQCYEGETLCFGAASGDQVWGLGLEGPGGNLSCTDCCFDCGAYLFDLGFLTCD